MHSLRTTLCTNMCGLRMGCAEPLGTALAHFICNLMCYFCMGCAHRFVQVPCARVCAKPCTQPLHTALCPNLCGFCMGSAEPLHTTLAHRICNLVSGFCIDCAQIVQVRCVRVRASLCATFAWIAHAFAWKHTNFADCTQRFCTDCIVGCAQPLRTAFVCNHVHIFVQLCILNPLHSLDVISS